MISYGILQKSNGGVDMKIFIKRLLKMMIGVASIIMIIASSPLAFAAMTLSIILSPMWYLITGKGLLFIILEAVDEIWFEIWYKLDNKIDEL